VARGIYRSPVNSTSMAPVAQPGDAFVIARPGRRPTFGDVVAVVAGSRAVVHRVVGRRGALYLTKGDASPYFDSPARRKDVLGLVRAVEKSDGRVLRLNSTRGRLAGAALASVSWLEGALNGVFWPPPALLRRLFYEALRLVRAALHP
jgi:signal peptidase I